MKNHLKFRQCVYDMANLFLVGMEKIYTYEGSVNRDEEEKYRHRELASTHSTRVLLTRYVPFLSCLLSSSITLLSLSLSLYPAF